MRRFDKRLIAVLLLAVLAISSDVATGVASQSNDPVAFAQTVLRATYPELKGNVSISLDTDTDSDWRTASLVGIAVHVVDHAAANHSRLVLRAHLRLSAGRLSHALFSGSYVQQDLKNIVTYARRQNDTPDRVIQELQKAGIRFISDEEQFLKAAALHRLEPVIGRIQSLEASFVAVPPIPTAVDYEFEPGWVVEVQAAVEGGSVECYSLSVEPVHLRVERITRRSCR